MALISLDQRRLKLTEEVIDDLTTLIHDLDSLEEPIGDIIHSRVNGKINYIKKWLASPETEDETQAIIEINTLELLLEIVLLNRFRHIDNSSSKKITDKSQRIVRSIRLLNTHL